MKAKAQAEDKSVRSPLVSKCKGKVKESKSAEGEGGQTGLEQPVCHLSTLRSIVSGSHVRQQAG